MKNALLRSMVSVLGVVLVLGVIAPSAYARSSSQATPDGTSAAACPVPPPGFDILRASVAQLHYYGLPLPPQGSAIERANWAKDFQHLKSRFCGMGTPVPTTDRPPKRGGSANGYQQNDHWSGYIATNGGFTFVRGKWWVPTYCCSPSNSTAVQWVGIGGWFGFPSNLMQAGTETDPEHGHVFWWETWPKNLQQYQGGPSVGPGDEVFIWVDYNNSCQPNQSYAFMYNYRTGGYWGIPCQSFTPQQGSADWIVERTFVGSCAQYLTQTTQVNWHSAFAASTKAGGNTLQNISYYNNTEIDMVDNGTFLESTSVLGTGGDGGSTFNSTFDNNGTYCG